MCGPGLWTIHNQVIYLCVFAVVTWSSLTMAQVGRTMSEINNRRVGVLQNTANFYGFNFRNRASHLGRPVLGPVHRPMFQIQNKDMRHNVAFCQFNSCLDLRTQAWYQIACSDSIILNTGRRTPSNETANGVVCRLYREALCFQHVTRVHSTRVNAILFTLTRKVRPFLRQFSRVSHTEFHPNQAINVKSADKNPFTSLSKVWPSQCRFSRNWPSVSILWWTHLSLNYIQIGQRITCNLTL
jgi:hypothetical protein